jgi:hypothetical protein
MSPNEHTLYGQPILDYVRYEKLFLIYNLGFINNRLNQYLVWGFELRRGIMLGASVWIILTLK